MCKRECASIVGGQVGVRVCVDREGSWSRLGVSVGFQCVSERAVSAVVILLQAKMRKQCLPTAPVHPYPREQTHTCVGRHQGLVAPAYEPGPRQPTRELPLRHHSCNRLHAAGNRGRKQTSPVHSSDPRTLGPSHTRGDDLLSRAGRYNSRAAARFSADGKPCTRVGCRARVRAHDAKGKGVGECSGQDDCGGPWYASAALAVPEELCQQHPGKEKGMGVQLHIHGHQLKYLRMTIVKHKHPVLAVMHAGS